MIALETKIMHAFKEGADAQVQRKIVLMAQVHV